VKTPRETTGTLKAGLRQVLQSDDWDDRLLEWSYSQSRRLINPLLSFLLSPDETLKWRSVSAVGLVMSVTASTDMEAARVIMRRLIWSLNDESGGIGWGSPEAMGEIMACHRGLAEEYHRILVSYIRRDGNLLENELLERGVLWGIGRLAQVRAGLIGYAPPHVALYLESHDPLHRGLAAWSLGFLDASPFRHQLERLLDQGVEIRVYENRSIRSFSIGELAARAIRNRG